MKNKTFLIICREYLTRIQKKSFIIITILSFNILGDALRDVLDPKLKL